MPAKVEWTRDKQKFSGIVIGCVFIPPMSGRERSGTHLIVGDRTTGMVHEVPIVDVSFVGLV